MGAAFVGVVGTVRHYGAVTTAWNLVPAMATCGVGMGLAIAPLFNVILAGVGDHEVGTASGVLNAVQQLGSAVGIAVLGTVFFDQIGRHDTFGSAMQSTSWIAAGLMLVTAALVFLLPRHERADAS